MRLTTLRLLLLMLGASCASWVPVTVYAQGNLTVEGLRLTYTDGAGKVQALPRITQQDFYNAWGGVMEMDAPSGKVAAKGPVPAQIGGSGGPIVQATGTRLIDKAAVARAAGRALPVIGSGLAIWDIAQAIRCRGVVPALDAALECDEGQEEQTQTVTKWRYGDGNPPTGTWQSTKDAACSEFRDYVQSNTVMSGTAGNGCPFTKEVYVSACTGAAQVTTKTMVASCNGQSASTSYTSTTRTLYSQAQEETLCPEYTFGGQLIPAGSAGVGADGKCPTGTYASATLGAVADKIADVPGFQMNSGAQSPAEVAREAVENGVDLTPDAGPISVTGPGTATGPTTTTTTTPPGGGDPVTTTSTTNYTITYEGDTFTWNTTNVTNNADGSTTETTGEAQEDKECGLPGTPPCKIDETGTPEGSAVDQLAGMAGIDSAGGAIGGLIEAPAAASDLPWSFSAGLFGLPAGSCSPFTWGSRLGTIEWDPCTNSLVATVRSMLAWLMWAMTLLYVWRRANEALSGGRT